MKRRYEQRVQVVASPDPKGMVGGRTGAKPACVVPDPPGVEQAATGRYHVVHTGTGELPRRLASEGDAKMLACGREGGGGVVAKCLPVMGRTG